MDNPGADIPGGDLRAAVQDFFDSEILPRHRDWVEHVARQREPAPFLADLRARAKAAGLWNLGLPDRMSNLDYAAIAEITVPIWSRESASNSKTPMIMPL